MMTTFEFKNRWTGKVIASQEAETLGKALEILVRKGVSLRGVDLGDANLGGANLRGANLLGADLSRVYLGEADLREANLGYTNLEGSNFEGSNFEGANLREANLRGANLREANLRGSIIGPHTLDSNLRGTTIGPHTLDSLLTRAIRSDNYEFIAFRTSTKEILIRAGCRTILGTDAYRKHIEENYPGTPKARETLEILTFIDKMNNL